MIEEQEITLEVTYDKDPYKVGTSVALVVLKGIIVGIDENPIGAYYIAASDQIAADIPRRHSVTLRLRESN